jgi:hypothetical protein
MTKTAIWDSLGKTDPANTKSFKRAGGFSGTAVKPMWVLRRLTEEFGACGFGWGVNEPSFQVVPGDNREMLVYCTVSGWHGSKGNVVWGVGGDKIVTHIKANEQYNRPERWENDDEAFKKAFTDAIMNAFKFIGVAADVHMGRFDDNKYVQEAKEVFADQTPKVAVTQAQADEIEALMEDVGADKGRFLTYFKIDKLADLPATEFSRAMEALEAKRGQ